jgi:hypothetical protein
MNKVVITIPVYKSTITDYERISLEQCSIILRKYQIALVTNKRVDTILYERILDRPVVKVLFKPCFFKSPQTYNRLLTSYRFFHSFNGYDYLLMYHTDSFVFRDELDFWTIKGYDYIGAPLYEYDGTISPTKLIGNGNGGFSLHRVSSALKVLTSFRVLYTYTDILDRLKAYNFKGRLYHFPLFLRLFLGLGTNSHHWFNNMRINEDVFWGILVPKYFNWYKVASFYDARRFSLEFNCEKLYLESGGILPFGCHQWYKGEFLKFWRDKIEEQGYTLP